MPMVRAKVNAAINGWSRGEVITVERTRMVSGLIERQYLTVLEDNLPDFPADSPEGIEAARIAQVGPGDVYAKPPVRVTYRRSENEGGATSFGEHLPAGGGAAVGAGGAPADPAVLPAVIAIPPELMNAIKPVGGSARAELSVSSAAVPPRTGKGSGADAWRTFLEGQGIDTAEYPDRAALIAAWELVAKQRGL